MPSRLPDLSRATWRKSSLSGTKSDDCIEVASLPATVAVRDTKDRDGATFVFERNQWVAFISGLDALAA